MLIIIKGTFYTSFIKLTPTLKANVMLIIVSANILHLKEESFQNFGNELKAYAELFKKYVVLDGIKSLLK